MLKNLYFFFVVLFSGFSLAFFRSNEGLIILWAIGLFIFWRENLSAPIKLWIALGIWMGYFIINTLLIQSFHPFFMATYITKIMIAYWLLSYYKENIFLKFENTIYLLTVISLIFYTFQLFTPVSLYNLFNSIDLSEGLFPRKLYASIGIYTFHQEELTELFPRNAGFTWEPGPFSSYIVLAMFFNLARNGVKLINIKRFVIFLTALFTTQSSTGMVIFLVLIVWYAWESFHNIVIRISSVVLASAIVVLIFINVPYLQEKIISESEQDLQGLIVHAERTGSTYALGRFASFQLRWQDFKNYPVAGFGGNTSLQAGYISEGNFVAAISGIGNIIGMYGTIGTVIFMWLIFYSGLCLLRYYQYSSIFIFPLLILLIGFAFGIIESPLIVTLWLVPVFLNKDNLSNE